MRAGFVGAGLAVLTWVVPTAEGQERRGDRADLMERAREIAAITATSHEPRARTMDVLHCDGRIRIDPAAKTIHGTVDVRFRPFETPRQRIELDAEGLVIEEVLDAEGAPLEFEHDDPSLWIDLGREVAPDVDHTVRVRYHGKPRSGLTFLEDQDGRPQVWAQGQAILTRAWLPCRDHPDDRATLDLAVTVPSDLVTVGNGVLAASDLAEDGWRTDQWRMTEEFPTYVTSLVIGDLHRVDLGQVGEVPLTAWCRAGDVDAAARALSRTGRMMTWLEGLTGVQYPHAEYRQTFVRDFPFAGMENVTSTTLADDYLYDDTEIDAQQHATDALVVHELAHHWWGNWVTAATFADAWLNEGFVTYAEVLWFDHAVGPDTALSVLRLQQEAAVDALTHSGRCIVDPVYQNADDRWDEHIYEAGSAFLHLLRHVMGDEAFFAALRDWTATMQNRAVRTADFEELFATHTDVDLTTLFEQWLHRPGLPDLRFSWRHETDPGELVLVAEQRQAGDRVPDVYKVPLAVSFVGDAGLQREVVRLDQRLQEWRISCKRSPPFVRFNDGSGLFGNIVVQQPLEAWQAQALHCTDPLGRVEAVAMLAVLGGRLNRYADPGSEGSDWTRTLATACRAALDDDSLLVRAEGAATLGILGGETARLALDCAMLDDNVHVRAAAAAAMGYFESDRSVAELLLQRFALERTWYVREAMVDSISALNVEGIGPLLNQLARDDQFPLTLRGRALVGLAMNGGEGAVELAVRSSDRDQAPTMRLAAIEALGELAEDRRRARRTLISLLEDPSANVLYATLDAIEGIDDVALIPALVELYDRAPYGDIKTLVGQRLRELLDK